MIELKELTLKNYKCHRNLKLQFKSGVTGIVGDNGSGKSSIISAIRFLFTGEVDTENKQKSITVGETEGWVSGTLTINEKEAYLERHLSTSKVVLKYDGVTYNKATEVKDLWAKLLQIDGSIFNNVIIAKQGEIPLLFSGDSMIRERIFQKIFLVPPTEKLRSVIWDQYIKTAPPEKFEEDVSLLQSEEARIAGRRNQLLQEIDHKIASIMNDAFLKCVMERIGYLEKCQKDQTLRPILEQNLKDNQEAVFYEEQQIKDLAATISDLDISTLKCSYDQMLAQKNLAEHKDSLEHDLFMIESRAPTLEQLENRRGEVAEIEREEKATHEGLMVANFEVTRLSTALDKLSELEGHAECPTCGQALEDTCNMVKKQREELSTAQRNQATWNAKYTLAAKKLVRAKTDLSLMEGQYQRVLNLRQQLARYEEITYSEDELKLLGDAVKLYETTRAQIQDKKSRVIRLQGELNVTAEKIKNLAAYDGEATVEEELQTMREVIAENRRRNEELEQLRVEQAKLEHELQLLEQRIETSLENHKSNEKRKQYIDKLQKAYDILHVSKFPRKLIESYSEHVQVHLSQYLEKFSIPYRAKIAEGFRIQMLDSEDRELPMVSGGQEMVVGICLRLALHKMFAQSFPIWIVDEGTTHLAENNRKAYFRLIDDIRTNKLVNQVLIIDHDNRLTSVVDQTIAL